MLILMAREASAAQVQAVLETLAAAGVKAHLQENPEAPSILAPHASQALKADRLEALEGVARVVPITSPFKLASADVTAARTVVPVGKARIGGEDLTLVGGPCGVESRDQLFTVARYVAEAGVPLLRAGAFKPRTSPYAFQGLGQEALDLLAQARAEFGLGIVTEATEVETFDAVETVADLIQIGARNMQNFALLRRAGRSAKPVLLKRGISATIQEWLMAAEYVMSGGNYEVILCERGIRTFETATRNTFDVSAVPVLKQLTHLPVVVDPSHAIGVRDKVIPLARAGVAAGADGCIVEFHTCPEEALSDGPQALYPEMLTQLVRELDGICQAIGRTLGR